MVLSLNNMFVIIWEFFFVIWEVIWSEGFKFLDREGI